MPNTLKPADIVSPKKVARSGQEDAPSGLPDFRTNRPIDSPRRKAPWANFTQDTDRSSIEDVFGERVARSPHRGDRRRFPTQSASPTPVSSRRPLITGYRGDPLASDLEEGEIHEASVAQEGKQLHVPKGTGTQPQTAAPALETPNEPSKPTETDQPENKETAKTQHREPTKKSAAKNKAKTAGRSEGSGPTAQGKSSATRIPSNPPAAIANPDGGNTADATPNTHTDLKGTTPAVQPTAGAAQPPVTATTPLNPGGEAPGPADAVNPQPATQAAENPGENPYEGLEYFDEDVVMDEDVDNKLNDWRTRYHLEGERVELGARHPFAFADARQGERLEVIREVERAAEEADLAAALEQADRLEEEERLAAIDKADRSRRRDQARREAQARAATQRTSTPARDIAMSDIVELDTRFPDINDHAARPATRTTGNPHRLAPAAPFPDPAGPDIEKIIVQPNIGKFPELVIDKDAAFENVSAESRKLFDEDPGNHLLLVAFNGGSKLSKLVGDDEIVKKAEAAVGGFTIPSRRLVFPITAAKKDGQGNYNGPFVVGLHTRNLDCQVNLLNQRVLAVNRDFAFYVVHYDELVQTWTLTIVKPTIGGGTTAARNAIRAAISLLFWHNDDFRRLFDQVTCATHHAPLDDRILGFTETLDPRWDERGEVYVVYANPCTYDAELWRKLTALVRGVKSLQFRHYTFETLPDTGLPGPRCVVCKNDNHFDWFCPFVRDPAWWGPNAQIKNLTDGAVAAANHSGRGAAPRGRGRGGRGGRGGNGRGNWANNGRRRGF